MRLLVAGIGVTIASSALPTLAQPPAPAPAASLGRVQFLETPTETVRGQFAPAPLPQFNPNGNPPRTARQASDPQGTNPGGTNPPGDPLPNPKKLPGPKVGEERNNGNPGPGYPAPGTPIPGTPYPGMPYPGAPGVVPGTPLPGQPIPFSPYAGGNYAHPVPYAQPVPYGYPVGPYTNPPGYPAGVGGPPAVVPGCDPGVPGGNPIPVTPNMPGLSPDGFSAGPIMDDPYLGSTYGFGGFPRAREFLQNNIGLGNGKLQITGEYLLWFVRAAGAPPLLTTSSTQNNGIIGQGDTRVIFGGPGQVLNNTTQSGARFGAVYYLPGNRWGVDGDVWFLARSEGNFIATTNDYPLLARPFVNANTGQNFSEVVAAPGLATGSATVNYGTSMWGADVNFRRGLLCGPCYRLDALVGFKFANLSENITITEQFVRTPNSNLLVGTPTAVGGIVQDKFETVNNFYGVNLGLAGEIRRGRWFLNAKASVGLGTIYQTAIISGSQRILTSNGGLMTSNSGLLAIDGANAGSFTRPVFGVMPDVNLTVGMYITPRLRVGIGYGFMYMNNVLRPGNIIDQAVDVSRIPNFPMNPAANPVNPPRPTLVLRNSDFFAQGITFSLNWTW